MCSCNHPRSDLSPWLQSVLTFLQKHRATVCEITALAVVLAALGGLVVFLLCPTDIERADADVKKGWEVVSSLEAQAVQAGQESHGHSTRVAQYRAAAEMDKDSTDAARLELAQSAAHGHKQLAQAHWERRDNLVHLAAAYRRLVSEAECEVLRAKNARDRGTPYKVAPRVRDLLAPILNAR